jgi:hypothetical protein
MFCQAAFDQWLTTIMPHLSPVSKPQATVLALWSFGMVLARSCALSAVSSLLAEGMQRNAQTVRQRRREWYYETKRKHGATRQDLRVETCFPLLLGGALVARHPTGPGARGDDLGPALCGAGYAGGLLRPCHPRGLGDLPAGAQHVWRRAWRRLLRGLCSQWGSACPASPT